MERAAGHTAQARRHAAERQPRQYEPMSGIVDAHIAAVLGEDEDGLHRIKVARDEAAYMGMRPAMWLVHVTRARLLEQLDRGREARSDIAAARRVIDEMADRWSDSEDWTWHRNALDPASGAGLAAEDGGALLRRLPC